MSLSKFQGLFAKADVQRQNRYRVSITGPRGVSEAVNLMCETAAFPGQNMRTSTDDLRNGPVREIVHGTTYGPITLNFVCTTGMPEKKWFENWQTFMVERRNAIQWQSRYYRDYVGEISMFSLDRNDNDAYELVIYEAFPKRITEQSFSNAADGYQTISVEFAFHHWVSKSNASVPAAPIQAQIPKNAPRAPGPHGDFPAATSAVPSPNSPNPHAGEEAPSFAKPVANPADQSFIPSPGQPVAQRPNGNGLAGGIDGSTRNQ